MKPCAICSGPHATRNHDFKETICTLCANQTWRVVGPRCRRCRLEYADEVIEVHGTGMKSNAGFC